MAREWWRRLPDAQRREYLRSDGIAEVALEPDPGFARLVGALENRLALEDRDATEQAASALTRKITRGLSIPGASVSVLGCRPADGEGELHGIYRPAEGTESDRITVWMRTAQRKDVVAIRTFLRTLLHEIGHHVDMRLLNLPHSYHTKGFYRRESALYRVITMGTVLAPGGCAATGPHGPLAKAPPPDVERGLSLLRKAREGIAARRPDERSAPKR